MALVAITLKIMPSSPDVDLEKLREEVKVKVEYLGGSFHHHEEQPIAFGLKALMCVIGWNEEKDPDMIETELAKLEGVNSVQITDVRRAIG